MKLITAIVNKEDSKNVCNELLKSKFYVTRLATTGGFLMAGNMTLLICTDDARVDDCIGIISKCCKQRTEIVPGTATLGLGIESTMPMEVTVGCPTRYCWWASRAAARALPRAAWRRITSTRRVAPTPRPC